MKIQNLTELRELLELVVQHDIDSIELEGVKVVRAPRMQQFTLPEATAKPAEDEDLLYYAAGGN